jgi:hypothetical protein
MVLELIEKISGMAAGAVSVWNQNTGSEDDLNQAHADRVREAAIRVVNVVERVMGVSVVQGNNNDNSMMGYRNSTVNIPGALEKELESMRIAVSQSYLTAYHL